MKTADLDYQFPPELIATEPSRPSRVLRSNGSELKEISLQALLDSIPAGDLLIVNDTKVLPMRVWSNNGDEVLFIRSRLDLSWEVLFLARDYKVGSELQFPDGIKAILKEKGLPQILQFDQELSSGYFKEFGEPALPPYIQAARQDRHACKQDFDWYQSAWAENAGSSAAPTASLHFAKEDLQNLEKRGVKVRNLTLHVGLGTFLPIKEVEIENHKMHAEEVFISNRTIQAIGETTGKIWALGTTATRALESWAAGRLQKNDEGFSGATDLFILPGFEFQVVDCLLTNFHQPKSTLLALVIAFAGEERVRKSYQFAIEKKFRLFSYGDLTAWIH